jgi:hypothetical protein
MAFSKDLLHRPFILNPPLISAASFHTPSTSFKVVKHSVNKYSPVFNKYYFIF